MTHREFIEKNFEVLAKTENAILFDAYDERVCEINNIAFACKTIEEFYEMVEQFGNDNFEE